MSEFNFIKNFHLTLIKFGGDKKIEIASGEDSKGVVVISSSLETKAVDLSRTSDKSQSRQLKFKKSS
ncbi:hypothetical protein HYT18_02465 [Candidatus Microgenomates bacterium]|nr:hypothetical protein [Candidatus Microgenomates bacterium]